MLSRQTLLASSLLIVKKKEKEKKKKKEKTGVNYMKKETIIERATSNRYFTDLDFLKRQTN